MADDDSGTRDQHVSGGGGGGGGAGSRQRSGRDPLLTEKLLIRPREEAFYRSVVDSSLSSAVLRARMGECMRMLSWVAESKRSFDDLKDLQTFFDRSN